MKKFLQKCEKSIDNSHKRKYYDTINSRFRQFLKGGDPNLDVARLKKAVQDSGLSVTDICTELQIDASTYYRKLNADGETFTIAQAKTLTRVLQIPPGEASEIFLT